LDPKAENPKPSTVLKAVCDFCSWGVSELISGLVGGIEKGVSARLMD
jgi:hypothetical protein